MSRRLIVPLYLVLCILLGGASLAGYLSNMVLQLLALPIIILSLLAVRRAPIDRSGRVLLIFTAVALLVPLLYLIPLPPSLWTSLPGREGIAQGYQLLGQPLPWLPLSLDPDRTLASVLWLLPAVAVLTGIVRMGAFRSSWIAWAIVLTTFAAVVVGALQIVGGASFYVYRITNYGSAVGFFANANHMATLLLTAAAFVAALYATSSDSGRRRGKGRGRSQRSGRLMLLVAGLAVLAVGLALNKSLAGLGLGIAVAAACFLLVRRVGKATRLLVLGGVVLASAAALTFVILAPLSSQSGENQVSLSTRSTSIGGTLSAAKDHLPLGSGIGSFADVYQSREDPNRVIATYMNHAHSDFAELFLELGIPGVILVIFFLFWWTGRAIWAWSEAGNDWARAASIASAAILAHSLVDYPLRTAAISAVFAACCALMANPRERGAARRDRDESEGPRHLTA